MSLIDDIRKDREAGTPGPWVFDGVFIEDNSASLVCDLLSSTHTDQQLNANARRIARVPEMEAALIAADELASAAVAWMAAEEVNVSDCVYRLRRAAKAYKEATK